MCCTPAAAPLFARVLPVDRILAWQPPWLDGRPAATPPGRVTDLIPRLRAVRPEVAVSVWPDVRVHGLLALSGARRRIGFPMTGASFYASHLPWRQRQLRQGRLAGAMLRVLLMRRLLTTELAPDPATPHHVDRFRVMADALRLPWSADPPWLTADPAAAPEPVQAAAHAARRAGRRLWVVHPGGRVPEQRWPAECFLQVVRHGILARGDTAVAITTPDVPIADWPAAGVPVVETPLLDSLLATLSLADAVLCNDTGVSHLAAALGRPVTAVFTASRPEWFGPWGPRNRVVRRDVCPHHPCLGRCVMPAPVCRDAVTVEDVLAALGPSPVAG